MAYYITNLIKFGQCGSHFSYHLVVAFLAMFVVLIFYKFMYLKINISIQLKLFSLNMQITCVIKFVAIISVDFLLHNNFVAETNNLFQTGSVVYCEVSTFICSIVCLFGCRTELLLTFCLCIFIIIIPHCHITCILPI